jgi:hypothetical protein
LSSVVVHDFSFLCKDILRVRHIVAEIREKGILLYFFASCIVVDVRNSIAKFGIFLEICKKFVRNQANKSTREIILSNQAYFLLKKEKMIVKSYFFCIFAVRISGVYNRKTDKWRQNYLIMQYRSSLAYLELERKPLCV